jgi:hypothetical protein
MHYKIFGLMCVLVLFFSVGCASHKSGVEFGAAEVDRIEKGVTTQEELTTLIGPPSSTGFGAEGTKTLIYQYSEAKGKASNLIPFVGMFTGGVDVNRRVLTILLDEDGVVKDYTFTETDRDQGNFSSEEKIVEHR